MNVANIKFSIIVPVYNTEAELPNCLDSLINQTYTNIEIICVNDGSTDSSLKVLNQYVNKDNRIKVITQENSGVSNARNNGIRVASGDYILFVDADDWLQKSSCETLHKRIMDIGNQADVVQFLYKVINGKLAYNLNFFNLSSLIESKRIYNAFDIIEPLLQNIPAKGVWDKAYKRKFIIDNNLFFVSDISHGEDSIFMMHVLLKNPQIQIIEDVLYNHVTTRKNSATNINKFEYLNKLLIYKNYVLGFNPSSDEAEIIKSYFLDNALLSVTALASTLHGNKYFIEEIKNILMQITQDKYKLLSGYKLAILQLFLAKYHLSWFYWKIIRPICKYCIVIPYRNIRFCKGG